MSYSEFSRCGAAPSCSSNGKIILARVENNIRSKQRERFILEGCSVFFISLGHFLQWQHALDLKIEHLIRGEYVVVVLFHLFDLPNNTKKPRLSIGKVDVV